ncbi:MAG: sugar phosphate isomerase/epimerase [Verrucomicrobia bacterium]|nr:sugar phosphate isomerase/epimerase [Verrucomicrobiota bacterium]
MKFGATQFSFDDQTLPRVFEIAREAGFDAIELVASPDENAACPVTTDKAALRKIRQAADKNGLALETLLGSFWDNTLCDPRPGRMEKSVENAKLTIEMAGVLGASDLLVIPGVVEVPWIKDYPPVPYEQCWKLAAASIRKLIPHARKHKVHLALENVWNCFLYSPLEFRAFVDQFDSEWVGAYFDTGNHHFMSQPDDWIRTLGKRIRRIHVKDYNRAKAGLEGFCEILDGTVNFSGVRTALRAIKYDRTLIAEVGKKTVAEMKVVCASLKKIEAM